ncbi:glycosyltransferase family 2 protein [Haloprofundus salinisoli]|uniref:glycosyltransferase family 2 protein n=1 Tax=Haloprofundus salinisoli TaxID=2876193 RepID=UPI001CCF1035|nr:glycosyltransferase family 2 protein [Haloprofundus salinisoli]
MAVVESVLVAVLLVSVFLVVYAYALYPLTLWAIASVVPTTTPRRERDELPEVALIVAAYNEETVIADKLENCLELDYPESKLDVVVFSDASSDRTDDIVRSYADRGIRLERIEGRVGKTACQNEVAEMVDAEVLVFSDANSMYEPDAVRTLVSSMGPDVGCVVGELQLSRKADNVEGESIWWLYNRFIKQYESRLGSVVKGNGAIYAVRSEAYVPLPADAISDFAEPLSIRSDGWRVVYEPDAVAREDTAKSVDAELNRKVRITTRSWHTLAQYLHLLNPLRYGFFSVKFASDTLLWWSTPMLSAVAFVALGALAALTGSLLYVVPFLAAVGFLLLGLVGYLLEDGRRKVPTVFHVPHYFLIGNYSLVVGAWNFVNSRNVVTWETANESSTKD